jgi:peptidoglycan/LPS O-acetylase OafA/YrhL
MNMPNPLPRHFYSLDALRGLAALSVVFWHWQHFFCRGTKLASFSVTRQPLYRAFWPFYAEGWRAVDLFFCLSGFIFFWLYGSKIGRGTISPRGFALLRFSRLYPLHLLTLLLVAAEQLLFRSRHGSFFVYPYNDARHFVLQLLFASHWGFQYGYSFNAPVWSVSMEVLLYFTFFVTCRLGMRRWWHLVLFVLAGLLIMMRVHPDLGRGVSSFFMGGLSFHAVDRLHRNDFSRRALQGIVVITVLAWLVVPSVLFLGLPSRIYHVGFPAGEPTILGKHLVAVAVSQINFLSYNLILFPLTVTALALVESRRGALGKRLSFLGHISYSSYLLHFPLQLGFVLIGSSLSPGSPFFYSPVSLVLFFGTLIPLSLGSYWFFEKPARSFLRAGVPIATDTVGESLSGRQGADAQTSMSG